MKKKSFCFKLKKFFLKSNKSKKIYRPVFEAIKVMMLSVHVL